MTNRFLVILLALVLVAPVMAHQWDGKSFTVALSGTSGAPTQNDTFTFQNGTLTSEWLSREGFSPAKYEADDDDFEADFFKGEDRVHVRGEIEDGKLEGRVKWNRHHEGARREWKFVEGATALAAPVAAAPEAKASLYSRLGGNAAITAVVNDFVDALVQDPVQLANPAILAAFKRTDVPKLKASLTNFVAHATGGPEAYTGKDMKTTHKDMGIGEKDWASMANIFVATLNKYKVPQAEQDELLAIVGTTKADIVTKP